MSTPNSNINENQRRRAFIITIVFLVAITANLVLSLSQGLQTNAWQHFVRAGLVLTFGIAAVIAAIWIRRGRIENGIWLLIIGFLFSLIGTSLLLAGFGQILAVIELILAGGIAAIVLPKGKRNRAFIVSAISAVLTFGFDFLPLNYRIPAPVVMKGALPAIAGVVILIVGLYTARQAWLRNNIRSRFLTFSLGVTLLSLIVIAVVSVNSLFTAGDQAQETSDEVLREQAQETLIHQTVDIAGENELILQGTIRDALDVAQQAAQIVENPGAFNTEGFWKADEHMFFGPGGQYINGEGDVSTVFVPNTTSVDEGFKQRLELLAYLDMALVPVYQSDPNSVAIYFVGTDDTSWLYPNINLGAILPAEYRATQDIFYTTGAPENNPERQVVWTPVYDDPAGQGLLVSAIAPVYTSSNKFVGIIGIDVSLAGLTAAIEQEELDAGGYSFMLDSDGRALALPEQGYRDFFGREREADEFGPNFASSVRSEFASVLAEISSGATGFQRLVVDDQELYIAYTTMKSTGWRVASVVTAEQVLAPVTKLQTELGELSRSLIFQRVMPVGIAFVIIVVVASIFFTNRLVNPIEQLTEGASKIGVGEWNTPLPQSELREIGGLSRTLSDMAAQLKNTLETLEQRVADRTQNLELAAEVGRSISQVRALDVMLQDACELIRNKFDLYYVQVYLTDPGQRNLILEAGTGEMGAQLRGRGHRLQLNTGSINGRAAVEKRAVVISDTAESLTFRPNPLLPDTRGEMAVPLVVGETVVGVLDMQTTLPGTLNEEVLPAFEALAGQLAVAIQNAELVAQAEEARAAVEAQARRLVRTGWSEHLDAIHKPEQFGFVFDRDQVTPLEDAEETELPDEGQGIKVPISLTGEELGSLVVELDEEEPSEQNTELINIVAQQVAQQIENLRLLESAERYRFEAEQAARRQTREGWQEYVRAKTGESLGYLYDLKEVRPHNNGKDDGSALTLPLKIRDEAIGKLAVQGLTPEDGEAVELANAVAERLGAHIESLRQYDQTQSALAQSEKLFDASRSLTQATDLQELVAAAVNTLDIRVINRALLLTFGYDSAGEIEQLTVVGNWWNETGQEVTPLGTRYSKEVVQVMPMFVSPTPVFFNDAFNDERVDETTMKLVKQLNLRAVAVLPLRLGTNQIGALLLEAEEPYNFTPDETRLFESLAPQIATVLENRQQYEMAQRQAEREAMLNTINQKIQSATSVEAVLQIAARELGHALGAPMTIAQLSMKDQKN
jgi:GAF domain-containing protein/HAMP domain-containing protein